MNVSAEGKASITNLTLAAAVQAAAVAAFSPTPAEGWWGAKMFMSAGLLEGLEQKQQRERGFDEDLQTKVYMDAHNAQRQGKKGLGKSSTLKIAGEGSCRHCTYKRVVVLGMYDRMKALPVCSQPAGGQVSL